MRGGKLRIFAALQPGLQHYAKQKQPDEHQAVITFPIGRRALGRVCGTRSASHALGRANTSLQQDESRSPRGAIA